MRFQVPENPLPSPPYHPSDDGDWHFSVFPAEDTLNFWKGIADVGLLEEVVTNINTELMQMLNGVLERAQEPPIQDAGTCP